MDRLERLVNLVAALIDTDRPLTRAEIRERIDGYSDDPEAFRRNFERDKDLLRQMGMPLSTESVDANLGDETGYRIPRERYELPDPGLDESELAALRLAASAVQVDSPWGDDAVKRALRKLGGAALEGAGGDPGDRGEPAQPARVAALPGEDAAATAFAAIGERRRIRFGYHGEERVVDPWRLSFRRGHWYLAGLDHTRGDGEERLFRLDRVEGKVEPTGPPGAFEPPAGAEAKPPPAWRIGEPDAVTAEVLVDAEQAPFFREAVGAEATAVEAGGGALVLRFPVNNVPAFRSLVLGFLDHAEVLGPPALRDDMVSWLEGVAAGNGGRSGGSDG